MCFHGSPTVTYVLGGMCSRVDQQWYRRAVTFQRCAQLAAPGMRQGERLWPISAEHAQSGLPPPASWRRSQVMRGLMMSSRAAPRDPQLAGSRPSRGRR
jgi:hypothetical protein